MPDIIKLLPDSVANQIAAGEVIQRPASLVKELMENAIDSGANDIRVNIKDAGRTLVQVLDNGCGMSPDDAAIAFERHSTSKISQASDLFAIRTLGFRGEALASIAAVAEVSLKTRKQEDDLGTEINIKASQIESREAVSCPPGSNFIVKNLFYNVPARRKFLKTNATEFRHIVNEFLRIALTHPDLQFSLVHNESEIYKLPVEQYKQRIVNLFGKNMNQVLIPLHTKTSIIQIHGFIGKPESAKKTFGEQFFFINNRFMRHPYLHKAVTEAYQQVLPPDTIPSYFLYMEASTESIDINIHPTKTEIKFEEERAIYQIIHASVREALGKHSMVPSLDFDVDGAIQIPVSIKNGEVKIPHIDINPDFNPFDVLNDGTSKNDSSSYRKSNTEWESLYKDLVKAETVISESLQQKLPEQTETLSARLFQLKNRYIFLAVKSGMMIINQKRAHERILYEKYLGAIDQKSVPAQQELYPVTIELNAADKEILNEIFDDICSLGFEISDLGSNRIEIRAMPAGLDSSQPRELIESFLKDFKEKEADIKDEASASLAASMARTSAIEYGRKLEPLEMQEILDQLFACSEPATTADGKVVFRILPMEDLDKLFD
jgi:DNA mismatch repair protein MutL